MSNISDLISDVIKMHPGEMLLVAFTDEDIKRANDAYKESVRNTSKELAILCTDRARAWERAGDFIVG